jgi:hypothetical protein
MRFELKNVKHMPSLSEETECFSATLHIDGVASFAVSNRGTGGPDDVRPLLTATHTEAEVNAWLRTHRPKPYPDLPNIEHDLEIEVSKLLTRELIVRDLRRLLRKSKLIIDGGQLLKVSRYRPGDTVVETTGPTFDRAVEILMAQ